MTRRLWVAAWLTVGVGLAPADDSPFVAAARRREQALANVRVEVHLEELVRAGSLSEEPSPFGKQPAGPMPLTDVTVTSDNALMFSGNRVRIEHNHPDKSADKGLCPPRPKVHVSDGKRGMSIFPTGIGNADQPSGMISRTSAAEMIRLYLWAPLVVHTRGLTPAMTPNLINDFRPGGKRPIGGRMCDEYVSKRSATSSVLFLVDPAAGHVIRRIEYTTRGRVSRQFDIRFAEPAGDLPTGWTHTGYGPAGKVANVLTATVTKVDREVVPSDDQFRLVFPPGYQVEDTRDDKTYRVQDDGSMREIDPSGQPLPSAVPQPTAGWLTRNRAAALAAGMAGLVLAAVVGWRHGRNRANP